MPEPAPSRSSRRARPLLKRPQLSPATRGFLLVAGWLLVALGIAGLVLPGLQGILILLLAGAVLSLVDPWFLKLMRRLFGRWPRGWGRLLRLRRHISRWLEPGRDDPESETGDAETRDPPQ